ncbi:hypothetical protein [Haloarchaeobius sp. HRN-SO-5]|uniref:hypothetical protein n=1 Tax=Haloarchaeobius sp. HRN-SO-5 TaxID=3446118 RepID=UPI003EC14CD1
MASFGNKPHRRAFLTALGTGASVALAGCSGDGTGTETTVTDTAADTETATSTVETTDTGTETDPVGELRYLSPRDTDDFDALVEERKLAALEQVLAVPEAADAVTNAVSSSAYHRIFEGVDFVEILAPHGMTVSGSVESGQHTIEYTDVKQVQALVDRESDQLRQLHREVREPHTITQSYDGMNMATVEAAMANERVQQALDGKNWFIAASDYSIITAYSEEYPLGTVTPVVFNWNDKQYDDGLVGVAAAVTTGETNEVLDVLEPTRETTTPLTDVAERVRGNDVGEYREGPIEVPGAMDDTNWELRRPDQTIERDGWTVRWTNTLHDAYRVEASYNGTPVFGTETKIPWMLSDYEPFGMQGPGVPEGRANWHFWDTLGFTGPGVIEQHDLRDGFRIRGSYHTGSLDHWEWRFGQNWGPYRYIIDWNFHDDGVVEVTSRHPTTGFRTTNGFPLYTFHLCVEPGFDAATVSTYDGSSWSQQATEGRTTRDSTPRLRVENADGQERLVFERPGEETYALQYDPNFVEYEQTLQGVVREMLEHQEYLDPSNYLADASLDGEKVLVRTLSSRDTGQGQHATTNPFAFRFRMRAENY